MDKGKVYLIGAGPGDPGLLTCRAKQLLSECDVVCYDKLVGAAILSLVPNDILLHEVGYRGYQGSVINYGMHPDVTEFALAGKSVARLKSGDPCIFGRTTEECRDLNEQGIRYEIVPGITAALGAACYSGFPLTSGGVASSVTFASGHQHLKTISSWGESGQEGGTLVLYMGAKKLAEHVGKLLKNGCHPDTPITLISSATRADQGCLVATLATVITAMENHPLVGPTLTIVGDVVAQGSEFNWRSQLPFTGTRFLVCGQYEGAKALQDKGAEMISIADLASESLLDKAGLAFLATQNGLLFQDLAAFTIWKQALQDNDWDMRKFTMPMSSHNDAVRKALRNIGIIPESLPQQAMTLTLSKDQATDKSLFYLVGQRKKQPLGYTLPTINWLLIDNIAVAKSIAENQPELFAQATVVPLSNEAYCWAQENSYLSADDSFPKFLDLSELATSCQAFDHGN